MSVALVLGMLLFVLPHWFSSLAPAVRDRFKARYGERAFKGVYALVSWLGLAIIIYVYWQTRGNGEVLYVPAEGMRHATMGLATLGMIVLASSHGKSHIRLWLQNPMSVGVALWSVGHLLSVGKPAVVAFYAALLLVAVVDIAASMARGKRPDFEPTWRSDIIGVIAGLVVTALLVLLFHPYVLGVTVAR
ncbi:MAG: hypothetical protein KGO53_01920 [Alphaproteobacteria bacterium]|nr:hypothetical protein [Alphaproteobacteria bacterium]